MSDSCAPGTFWDSNFYEMTVNNVMPLWTTAVAENLTQADRYLDADAPPDPAEAGFVLLQAREAAYASPWSYWFDYLTPQQVLLNEVSSAPLMINFEGIWSTSSTGP